MKYNMLALPYPTRDVTYNLTGMEVGYVYVRSWLAYGTDNEYQLAVI